MTHLLDTDTCIHLLRGTSSVVARAERHSPDDLAVSVITAFELLYGVERCPQKWTERERAKVRRLLASVATLPFTESAAERAANLRSGLDLAGTPIGPMDLLFAATAVDEGLILVTSNLREFGRVPGLSCLTWLR